LRNDACLFLASFSGFIPGSDDILLGELSAIYHGLIMAKDLGYAELACYSDSLTCINLINGPIERYHIYAGADLDSEYHWGTNFLSNNLIIVNMIRSYIKNSCSNQNY